MIVRHFGRLVAFAAVVLAAGEAGAQFCENTSSSDYWVAVKSNSGPVVEGQSAVYVLERYNDEEGTDPQTGGDAKETQVFVLAHILVAPDESDFSKDVYIREDQWLVTFNEGESTATLRVGTDDSSPNLGDNCRQPGEPVGSDDGPCSSWADTAMPTLSLIQVFESQFYDDLVDAGIIAGGYLPHYSCIVVKGNMPVLDIYQQYYETWRDLVPIVDTDGDGPPVVTLSVASSVALEGIDESEEIVVSITRARSEGSLSVDLVVSEDGEMLAAGEKGSRSVAFADGESTVEIRIPTVDDEFREADSIVKVQLQEGTSYTRGTVSTVEVTVADNDISLVTISRRSPETVDEGDDALFRLTRNVSRDALVVLLRVSETEDMVAIGDLGEQEAVFEEGDRHTFFTVPTVDDEDREYASVVTVEIVDGDDYDVDAAGSATVNVTDNEEGALPQSGVRIRAQKARVAEGGDVVFVLERRRPLNEAITVNVSVSETGKMIGTSPPTDDDGQDANGGDGEDAEDAEAEPGPCITPECKVEFRTMASTTMLVIGTVDDNLDEPDSIVTARIESGPGYDVDPLRSASVTVQDDDLGSRVSIGYLNDMYAVGQQIVITNFGETEAEYEMTSFHTELGVTVVEIDGGIRGTVPAQGMVVIRTGERLAFRGPNRASGELRIRASPSVVGVVTVDRTDSGVEITRWAVRSE